MNMVVSLEDIAEEILGEIQDEYDAEEALYQKLPEGGYLFSGMIGLDDFNEIMGANLSIEDTDTLGGYIYRRSGHVPGTGEEVQTDNLLLTVAQVTGRRIKKVSARWLSPEQNDNKEGKDFVDG
jgi:putative hemolysin